MFRSTIPGSYTESHWVCGLVGIRWAVFSMGAREFSLAAVLDSDSLGDLAGDFTIGDLTGIITTLFMTTIGFFLTAGPSFTATALVTNVPTSITTLNFAGSAGLGTSMPLPNRTPSPEFIRAHSAALITEGLQVDSPPAGAQALEEGSMAV